MHDNANLLMRPVQLGLPFIARIFHGPLYNSEGRSLSCAVPEHQLALLAMPTADFSSNLSYDNENAKRWQTFRYVRSDIWIETRILEGNLKKGIFQIIPSEIIKSNVSNFVSKCYPFSWQQLMTSSRLYIFQKGDGDVRVHLVTSYK